MRAVRYAGAGIIEPVEEVVTGPGPGEVQVRVDVRDARQPPSSDRGKTVYS